MICIEKIETFVYRYPLANPVQTSFGIMLDRPMVLVKVTDHDGVIGWGEIWCNFPNVGAEHRARLTDSVVAPLLIGEHFKDCVDAFEHLTAKTWVLGLQTAEIGPLAQVIAGLDIALHDLVGKRQQQPLWQLLGGISNVVPAYASGINPVGAAQMGERALAAGFTNLKLKIGFGAEIDRENIEELSRLIGGGGGLMVDANQAFDVASAIKFLTVLDEFDLKWLEEPIPVDRPNSEWQQLKSCTHIPLAGGENIFGNDAFDAALAANVLSVIQPDLAKWGGLSMTVPLARKIIAAGQRYCPHYLGGGVGLVASAHALAAVGGDGMLEVDGNTNPLREALVGDMLSNVHGVAELGSDPGLGYIPDIAAISRYLVPH